MESLTVLHPPYHADEFCPTQVTLRRVTSQRQSDGVEPPPRRTMPSTTETELNRPYGFSGTRTQNLSVMIRML